MANTIPTIIIGVGGIGSRIVWLVNNELSDLDKQTIATVCLDTDTAILSKLRAAGIDEVIQTSSDENAGRYAEKVERTHPETKGWLHNNSYINGKGLNEGAGQIRQLSRLAMLACVDDYRFNAIDDAINKVNNSRSVFNQSIKVFIVGSIAGGTGAGLMLQLPLYLKERILSKTQRGNVLIRGLFIGPTITEEKQDNDEDKITATYANAYACVKEINAFNTFATRSKDDIPIRIEYYVPKKTRNNKEHNPIPYDYLFLLDKHNCRGGVLAGDAHLENYIRMAADILRAQLSSVGVSAYSAEDNLIRGQIAAGGLNRFCGAGTTHMVYPVEKISEYCALRWASETISNQWRTIDEGYRIEKQRMAEQQALDPSFIPVSRDNYFTKTFKELSEIDSSNQFYKLLGAELASEGTVDPEADSVYSDIDPEVMGSLMLDDDFKSDRVLDLIRSIDRYIETRAVPESIDFKREACIVNSSHIENASDNMQMTIVDETLKAIKNYGRAVKNNLSNYISAADNIIPVVEGIGENPHNLLSTLKEVHPITARHILLCLKIELGKRLTMTNKQEETFEAGLDYIYNQDFDPDQEGIQSASEVFGRLVNEGNSKGLLSFLKNRSNSAQMSEFAGKFSRDVETQVSNWREYNLSAFKSRTYREIIRRIEVLLNVYQIFFDSLPESVKKLNDQVRIAEAEHEIENEITERFVFARKQCKCVAYEMIKDKVSEITLPDSTKRNFAEKLYKLFSAFYVDTKNTSEIVRDTFRNKLKDDTQQLFTNTVLKSLRRDVNSKASDILNFDIIRAMEYELLLKEELKRAEVEAKGMTIGETSSADEVAFTRFKMLIDPKMNISYSDADLTIKMKDEFRKVFTRATPFIGISEPPQDEAVYWGVNDKLLNDMSSKMQSLLDVDPKLTPSLTPDHEFNIHELLCYRVVYGILPEHLTNYNEKSTAKAKYDKLVNNMYREAAAMGGKLEEENEISPHLDKRWHHEAYIPELDPEVEKNNRFNDFLTMVGLLGLDPDTMIQPYVEYDNKRWKYLYTNDPYDIYMDGELAMVSYAGLYRSMAFNKLIKRDIINEIETETAEDIRQTDNIEHDIYNHRIIHALFHVQDILSDGDAEMTALDLLQLLSVSISEKQFKDTINGLSRFIWNYCLRACVDEQDKMVYQKLMRELIDKSKSETSSRVEIRKMEKVPI